MQEMEFPGPKYRNNGNNGKPIETMESLRWDSLESRRDVDVLKLAKKCILGKCPQFFNNYFVLKAIQTGRDLATRREFSVFNDI
jgi:hypothetical protein